MKTIVVAATKGGTGKTSLAFALGIEAAKHGTVYLADMDPQKSLAGLCERRSKESSLAPDNPMLLDGVGTVSRAVADLTKSGYARDFLIVDTPGSFVGIIREAITAADCIVLPVQPSVLDILAQEDVAKLVDEVGKSNKTLFVINRIDPRAGIDDTMERIGRLFPNRPVKITQRLSYSKALIGGLTGQEIDKKCASEIKALWTAIEKIIGTSHDKEVQPEKRRNALAAHK
jgi:chromosome partitioning protein